MVSPCVTKIIVFTLSDLNINLCCYPFTLMIFFSLIMILDFLIETKTWLSTVFEMKDLGEAEFILGVKITRNRIKRILGLSQKTYIEKILEKFRMANASTVETRLIRVEN